MDETLVHSANNFLSLHDFPEDFIARFEGASELLFVAVILVLLFAPLGGSAERARRAGVGALISAGMAVAITGLIARLVDRPRPFVAHPSAIHLFAAHAADAGFPSDHATAAFAIATAVMLRDRLWGSLLLAAAAAVAIGRVAIGVHYPSDVIVGALIGAAAAGACWIAPIRGFSDSLAARLGLLIDHARGRAEAAFRYS
jgi:undecaprenyl-diphosphatase